MEWQELSPGFGVELLGIDLRRAPPQEVVDRVRNALLVYGLVLVRGQPVNLDEQLQFARWFGPINTRGYSIRSRTDVEMYISNSHVEGVAREGPLMLHQDHCFLTTPLPAICAYGEEVSQTGGETIFVDARDAYDRLPEKLRLRVSSLSALHICDYVGDHGNRRFRVSSAALDAPRAVHPVVLRHPTTGRPILYVNRLMTDSIVGLDDRESEEVLDELMTFFEDPTLRYEHRWERHDLLVWDNLAVQHGRRDFPPSERRSLRRVQIG